MKTKVIVLTDIHCVTSGSATIPDRRGDFADILLLRAVHRINRYLKPDLVIIGGDLCDDESPEALLALKEIADLLTMPTMIIPGNHDCAVEDFFKIFPENPDYLDINGCRFIPFYDAEMPDYNAVRSQSDLYRMRKLAREFSGPVISVQHVAPHQPSVLDCPYNYTNIEDVITAMKESGVDIAISGHYHAGFFSADQPFGTSVCVPALCEKPFRFWELNIDEKASVTRVEHQLSLPEDLRLFDTHIHSHFAYCDENMNFSKAIELADIFNLGKLSFSEHSGHLYYSRDEYWGGIAYEVELSAADAQNNRFPRFLEEATPYKSATTLVGLEIDCNFQGHPMIRQSDLDIADIKLGAIHTLPKEVLANSDSAAICFKKIMESFVQLPMDIIAHPFRVFRRSGLETPEELFPFMVELLKTHNLAAELNFHTNEPCEKFFIMCLEEGVKISLGSDSHNLYEVGEFYPHLTFLEKIGADMSHVLR